VAGARAAFGEVESSDILRQYDIGVDQRSPIVVAMCRLNGSQAYAEACQAAGKSDLIPFCDLVADIGNLDNWHCPQKQILRER
jgi:hypothetical protein